MQTAAIYTLKKIQSNILQQLNILRELSRLINSLPADLRLEVQFEAFRRQLKMVLFIR